MRRQPTTPCLPACAHRHSHTRQSPRAVLLTAGLLAFALWPSTVQAWDLTMSLANLTGPTAGSGTFEVLLTNTGPSVAVAAFSFEVTVDPSSGVQFTGATTETVSAPYIFEGTGGLPDPTSLPTGPVPTTDLVGADAEFTYSSIAVGTGGTFGLGMISYSVSPQAPPVDVPISFVAAGTSLTDPTLPSGLPIPFVTDDTGGVIPLASSVVPEPSGLWSATCAIVLLLLARGLKTFVLPA